MPSPTVGQRGELRGRFLLPMRQLAHRLPHLFLTLILRIVLIFLTCIVSMQIGIAVPVAAASTHVSNTSTPQVAAQMGYSSGAQPFSTFAPRTSHPNTVSASQPWSGTGDVGFYTYVGYKLDDRLDFKVNVANGNLLVHSRDDQIADIGVNLDLDHYYNSLSGTPPWNINYAATLQTEPAEYGGPSDITYYGPTGESAYFVRNSDGTYKAPPGINASLSVVNGNYVLSFHHTGMQYTFSDPSNGGVGSLMNITNKNGIGVSIDPAGSQTFINGAYYGHMTLNTGSFYMLNEEPTLLTDQGNRSVHYSYDSNYNLTSETDANGQVTSYGYTGGLLTSITDPLSRVTRISYVSGTGQVSQITDAAGNTIQFAYHASTDSACSGITSPALPCTVVTDQNGHTTIYAYNSNLQVAYTKDALGHTTSQSFDALNYNVTQQQDALADMSTFKYDVNNNLTTSTDGSGATTSFTYPASGSANQHYPLTQTDPQGNTTNYAYDTNGNLLSATDKASNSGLTYTYTSNGQIATQKDADGNITTYTYAPIQGLCSHTCPPPQYIGNLTTITPPSPLGQTTLTYDTLNRVSSLTDGNGHKTTYTYDNLDRVTKITYSDGSSISYSYDGDGNLLSETDATGTTSFTYDKLNRELTKTLPDHTVVTSTYDKVGNLTSINDGTGIVNYTYDAANRMTVLTEPDGAKTTYGYDNANRKTSIQYPNGTGMLLTYDGAGHELTNTGGAMNAQGQITTTYDHFVYSYTQGSKHVALLQNVSYLDPVGQSATYSRNYRYDSLGELTDASLLNSSQSQVNDFSYGYDANGNLTSKHIMVGSVAASYSYNAANELTSSSSAGVTTTYTYDGNGNLTGNSSGLALTYNAANQTTAINSKSYTYSGANQNDRVTVNSDRNVYSTLGLSSTQTSSGTTAYVRCSCGLLNDERTPDGKKYYYLFDGLGSIVGLTDSSGHDVNRYDYDPFGNLLNTQTGVSNPWMYAGGYYDSSTHLYKFGIRYYDPGTGRWTQRTPVGGSLQETTKANPYKYADDDPVNEVDPSGKDSLVTACLVGAGVGVIVGAVTLALSLISGGAGFSLIVFALTLYFPGAGDAIAIAIATGCIGGVAAPILLDIAHDLGMS